MLVTFHSKDSAPVTLFGQVAVQLLHMMGHSGKVPGAKTIADVPANIDNGNFRLLVTAARRLRAERQRYAVVSSCAGGGLGAAVLLENPDFAG